VNREDKADGYKYQALYSYRLVFSFKDESGALGYLSGKQVAIAPEDIWFLEDYSGAYDKVNKIISEKK
jgi:23S rRNA pseudouridine955/2504/2580 synthase